MELQPSRFSLAEALQSVMLMVRERAGGRGIALSAEIDPEIDQVEADERKVKQIVLNLLTNAVKFTPAGGQVHLGATARAMQWSWRSGTPGSASRPPIKPACSRNSPRPMAARHRSKRAPALG
jgi:light-regulated signal transduction histidine kinase (bacteriophytochrome)